MPSNDAFPRLVVALSAFAFAATAATSATAGTLEGRLVDSMTGTPIPDATVRVVGSDRTTSTDERGRWSFDLPRGSYELEFRKRLGERLHEFRLVNQHVPQYKPADSWIATDFFLERGAKRLERPIGAPVPRIDHPSGRDRGPVEIDGSPDTSPPLQPRDLTIPDMAPATIRVARRSDKENCDNPIVAIEEMTLDEYVRGVLPPEIGVFRNLEHVGEVYRAFALAAKSYGLYFMLVYDADNRRTVSSPKEPHGYEWFHIDDTPCNQRYSDRRLDKTDEAADATRGELLVKQNSPQTLDKFEYAASCGEHGTRPEYQQEIVPDEAPPRACVGDWCGHDDCAGHEDHPGVPGDDRCLVRGICQWGAAEWAEDGKSAQWLLDHYQPNLESRTLWKKSGPETVDLAGYVHPENSRAMTSGIEGATVTLDGTAETTADETGRYVFSDLRVDRGSVTLSASKTGFESNEVTTTLEAGRTNSVDIPLEPVESVAEPSPTDDAGGTDVLDASSAADTSGAGRSSGGGLGPILTRSRGSRRDGCALVSADRSPAAGWPGLFVGMLVFVAYRRRRRGA